MRRLLALVFAVALLAAPAAFGATGMPSDDDPGGGGGWVKAGDSCSQAQGGYKCPCYIPNKPGLGTIGTCQCKGLLTPWGIWWRWEPV